MTQSHFKLKKWILLLVDLAILFVSLYLSLKIRYWQTGNEFLAFVHHYQPFIIIFLFWLVVFYLFDLYDLKKIKSTSFLISTYLFALSINTLLASFFFYFSELIISPKITLIFVASISFLLLLSWRLFWRSKNRSLNNRVAIIGNFDGQISLLNDVLQPAETDYNVVGFITLSQENTLLPQDLRILGHYKDLEAIIAREEINELVAAFNYYKNPEATSCLSNVLSTGVTISELSSFYEQATGKVPVDYIDQIWFLSQLKKYNKVFVLVTRLFDFFLSIIGLILSLPLMLVIAIFIKFDSTGSVFYKQIRLGLNEKPFETYKFRTMIDNAEQETGAVWADKNDSRITRVGKFLRKTRLDELPQLINILKGEMSFVGPRPERPEFVEQLKSAVPYYAHRHLVKPGLTGWAQIKYQYTNSTEQAQIKLQYDLYFIINRSLLLYLVIIIRTIRIVITHKGQ